MTVESVDNQINRKDRDDDIKKNILIAEVQEISKNDENHPNTCISPRNITTKVTRKSIVQGKPNDFQRTKLDLKHQQH